jgi:hypothetical protein
MANEEHLKILRQGVAAWNRWREEHRDIAPNLVYADLRGAHLEGGDLSRADLFGANLPRANLLGANLLGANLLVLLQKPLTSWQRGMWALG